MRLAAAFAAALGGLAVVGLVWRSLSHRWSLPFPAWMGAGVDLPLVATVFGTDRTLARIGARTGQRVLEIGPGPGRLLIPIAQRVQPHGEAVGVDIQPAMIARLKARAAAAGVTNLVGIVADATTMTLSGQFDAVVIALALGEIPNREATLRRCLYVLKPGGMLSITEMIPDPHFVSQRTVKRLAEAAGFQHVRTHGSRLSFTVNFLKP